VSARARDSLRGAPAGASRQAVAPARNPGGGSAPAPAPDPADKRICVARIGAAHGTTGEVRLWSFTGDPQAVARYGALTAADGRPIEIASLRPGKGFFIARIAGVTDRNGAERLRNLDLFIPRERLPPAAADEYYHADLIGLAAQDREGNPLGTVIAVHNFGAGDLLEVAPARGETLLLPFTTAVAPEVDIASGRIVIDLPAEIEADAELQRRREG
jgi:16S rRNA processing protein RimM